MESAFCNLLGLVFRQQAKLDQLRGICQGVVCIVERQGRHFEPLLFCDGTYRFFLQGANDKIRSLTHRQLILTECNVGIVCRVI